MGTGFRKCGKTVRSPTGGDKEMKRGGRKEEIGGMESLLREMMSELRGVKEGLKKEREELREVKEEMRKEREDRRRVEKEWREERRRWEEGLREE